MKLWSSSFLDRRSLPVRCAFGRYRYYPRELADDERFELSDNLNPHLAWSDIPAEAQSLALLCVDHCAPADRSLANVPGKVIPRAAPRTEFCHWIVVDLPPSLRSLEEGALSRGVEAGGKSVRDLPGGGRQGANDFTSWFADDPEMRGRYLGYDGPCPPWNDELIHWYEFTLHALDTPRLEVGDEFGLEEARAAMEKRSLGHVSIEGFYFIYPEARFGDERQMTARTQAFPDPTDGGSP